jgi:hypothetical protein
MYYYKPSHLPFAQKLHHPYHGVVPTYSSKFYIPTKIFYPTHAREYSTFEFES